jgi:protein-S-isoprenylcysteine O-methyltransferase Ste14
MLGSFVFLVLAPGVVVGLAPWWVTGWTMGPPMLGTTLFRFLGVILMVAGAPVVLDSFARFAIQGLGTPAPVLPTQHLVVTGLYRYVRNPMYVGVAAVIFGQALLLNSTRLFIYGACVSLGFQVFVVLYEEPKLRRTFGEEYEQFCRNVPRWIPRIHAWRS